MRMVFPHDIPDDPGGLLVRFIRGDPQFVHSVKDPPLHRLEAVADIGQGPRHDDTHRIVQEGILHRFRQIDGGNATFLTIVHKLLSLLSTRRA